MVVLFIVVSVAVDQVEFNEIIINKKKTHIYIKYIKKNQEKHNIEQHKAKRYLIIDLYCILPFIKRYKNIIVSKNRIVFVCVCIVWIKYNQYLIDFDFPFPYPCSISLFYVL